MPSPQSPGLISYILSSKLGKSLKEKNIKPVTFEPDIIFLDEPTGNLDNHTSKEVINYLNTCANEFKSYIIVATHDPEFRGFSDKILTMDSGVFA